MDAPEGADWDTQAERGQAVKVYIVRMWHYEDYDILSAWSTRELAEADVPIQAENLPEWQRKCVGVEEVEVTR